MEWTGVIGLMSGTSLDGLDCCYVEFTHANDRYLFRNLQTRSIPYTAEWRGRLQGAFYLEKQDLLTFDADYGHFLAAEVKAFIHDFQLEGKVNLIASHGHTVFHQPGKGITVQIGSGEVINGETGINVISDFRITDVELGGQGAPLVPVGDHYLFYEYAACLNLGGFSNISFVKNAGRIAFDISPCNLPLNIVMVDYFGKEYDSNGDQASLGHINEKLLKELNALAFYAEDHPKSLGFEWLKKSFLPIVDKSGEEDPKNLLRTITEHIAVQIARVINANALPEVFITGGGAYNSFLVDRIKSMTGARIIIPGSQLIEFKEALVFAFLGYLNLKDTINTFKSVTGASRDSIGGKRHFSH